MMRFPLHGLLLCLLMVVSSPLPAWSADAPMKLYSVKELFSPEWNVDLYGGASLAIETLPQSPQSDINYGTMSGTVGGRVGYWFGGFP